MLIHDPIGDALTRIRNAQLRAYTEVEIPYTKVISEVLGIIKEEGFITNIEIVEDSGKKSIRASLEYGVTKNPAIRNLKRISKPGLRKYVGYKDIPKVLNGLGISILSTSKGIMSGNKAKAEKVGGELLCTIY